MEAADDAEPARPPPEEEEEARDESAEATTEVDWGGRKTNGASRCRFSLLQEGPPSNFDNENKKLLT